MITEARRKKIADLIEHDGIVNLKDLVNTFDVSIYTIRRDLNALADKGVIKKIHGGAVRVEKSKWIPSFEEGKSIALDEKKYIAKKAAELIEDQDTIFLMGSLISLEMLPLIRNKNITVVTNSLNIALSLSDANNIETIIIGGRIKNYKANVLGSRAILDIGQYHFDKAFIPCGGVDLQNGISTSTLDSSDFLKAVIRSSRQNIIICDYRKLKTTTFAHVCSLNKIHILITDQHSDQKYLKKMNQKGITIIS